MTIARQDIAVPLVKNQGEVNNMVLSVTMRVVAKN
jgi:hypothetical protein